MKRHKILLSVIVFMCQILLTGMNVSAGEHISPAIPAQAKRFQGNYYYKYERNSTWQEAKKYCESKGGHLVVISNQAENSFVKTLFVNCSYKAYWMGGYREDKEWKWINDEKWTFSDWHPGEPNSDDTYAVLQMWDDYGWMWDDTWNDGDHGQGEKNQGFVCEWESAFSDKNNSAITYPGKVKVNLNANGGVVSKNSITVKTGSVYQSLPSPTRYGYSFEGWYTKKSGGSRIKNSSKVTITKETTLYAHWKRIRSKKDNVTSKNISGSAKGFTYSASFQESYFVKKNSEKTARSGLAKLSGLAAMSTYKSGQTEDLLTQCGFKYVKKKFSGDGTKSGHSSKKDNDHGTIYLGRQTLDDGTVLIAAIISGYSKGSYEWVSNFNLGTGSIHTGFNRAASEMVSLISEYVPKNVSKSKVKFWVTGHSRGGALTNLVTIKLIQKGYSNKNCYAYGFATPQYTTGISGDYSSIINYVSPHDFVPCVAPAEKGWGYKRLGETITFSDKKTASLKTVYASYTGRKYKGFNVKQKNTLLKAFRTLGKSKDKYGKRVLRYKPSMLGVGSFSYFSAADYAKYGIGYAMTDSAAEGIAKMLTYSAMEDSAANLTALLVIDQKISPKINDSHEMIAYLAWLDLLY